MSRKHKLSFSLIFPPKNVTIGNGNQAKEIFTPIFEKKCSYPTGNTLLSTDIASYWEKNYIRLWVITVTLTGLIYEVSFYLCVCVEGKPNHMYT